MAKNENLKPTQPIKIVRHFLKVEFTHDQIHEFGTQLARASLDLSDLMNQKKTMAAEFKAKIEAKIGESESLSNKIATGHEYKMVECEERHNDPNTGMKTIHRKDTGELVEKKSMSADEMQLELDITTVD